MNELPSVFIHIGGCVEHIKHSAFYLYAGKIFISALYICLYLKCIRDVYILNMYTSHKVLCSSMCSYLVK